MVAVEAVYGMLGAISPLLAMLYLPGGGGMVALLQPKCCVLARCICSEGACGVRWCVPLFRLKELCGLYTVTLLSSQPRARAPSTSPTEMVRVSTLFFAICLLI
jgi:hypothetical protein